jgi:hypothetical protein
VGHRDHRGAQARVRVPDQLDHRGGRHRIELRGRLVGEQQPGLVRQRDRQGQPLLLTPGQLPARRECAGRYASASGQGGPTAEVVGEQAPGLTDQPAYRIDRA